MPDPTYTLEITVTDADGHQQTRRCTYATPISTLPRIADYLFIDVIGGSEGARIRPLPVTA